MKKLTLLVAALTVLSMSSCKKDRTCTCIISGSGFSVPVTIVVTKTTKRAAKQGVCASGTETTVNGNGTTDITTITCTVK